MRNSLSGERGLKPIVFLAFLMLSAFVQTSPAKDEKPGAELLIETVKGATWKGELLAVKGEELVIGDYGSFDKLNLHLDEVKTIHVVKKSRFLKSVGLGLLSGGGTGMVLGFAGGDDPPGWFSMTAGEKAVWGGLVLGILGTGIGAISGAFSGIDEFIDLRNLSDEERAAVLRKLHTKSRFQKAYPLSGANSRTSAEVESRPEKLAEDRQPSPLSFKSHEPGNQAPKKFSRFHLTFDSGFFYAQGTDDLKQICRAWGFGDARTYEVMGFFSSWNESMLYPAGESEKYYFLKNIKIEYSLTHKLALGFLWTQLGQYKVQGYRCIKKYDTYWLPSLSTMLVTRESGMLLTGDFDGKAYFLTAGLMSVPDGFIKKDTLRIGGGLGVSDIKLQFILGETIDSSKRPLSLLAFAEYDHFFNRRISFGLNLEYKWIPFKIDSFRALGHYNDSDAQYNEIVKSMMIDFSGQKANLGGLGFGINFGLHL